MSEARVRPLQKLRGRADKRITGPQRRREIGEAAAARLRQTDAVSGERDVIPRFVLIRLRRALPPMGAEKWQVVGKTGCRVSTQISVREGGLTLRAIVITLPLVTRPQRLNVLNRLGFRAVAARNPRRSEEHTSELQSHSFISYAVFC